MPDVLVETLTFHEPDDRWEAEVVVDGGERRVITDLPASDAHAIAAELRRKQDEEEARNDFALSVTVPTVPVPVLPVRHWLPQDVISL
jgi:hypothetical protein